MRARGQVAEVERAERDAPQREHRMPDGLAHPAHLPLAALADRDLEHVGAQAADPRRGGPPVVELDALAQRAQRRVAHRPAPHLGPVRARHLVARVHEVVGEVAVVRQQDEPGRVGVEAADGYSRVPASGTSSTTVGRPCVSCAVETTPAGLWTA